jgi:hypothetical protein
MAPLLRVRGGKKKDFLNVTANFEGIYLLEFHGDVYTKKI